MRRLFVMIWVVMTTALVAAQDPQSEFVPVTEIPASEQLPAAPLVIAAYAFVWLAFVAYVWVMWRKLGRVERDLTALGAQIGKRAR